MTTRNPGWHPMWSEPGPAADPFHIVVTRPAAALAIVTVTGELDAATCPELDRHLDVQVRDRGLTDVVVDLTGLTFLAACGLATLVRTCHGGQATQTMLHVVAQQTGAVGRTLLRFVTGTVALHPDIASARKAIRVARMRR